MSLTSFLDDTDVKQKFRQEFNKPRLQVKKEILAEPLSQRYSLVGTAFDYLLRFHINNINPKAIASRWIAYSGFELLTHCPVKAQYDFDTGHLSLEQNRLIDQARKNINQAESDCKDYRSTGKVTRSLLKSTIRLAQLDVIYRTGYIDDNLGFVYEEDIEDLNKMLSLVNADQFKSNKICLLNPNFGAASYLVGGADADLLIDDTLIDIKVTKIMQIDRDYFNQLIGYFILHWLFGIGDVKPKQKIFKIGIFFPRFAHLETYRLKELINQKTFRVFVNWFVERARQKNPRNYDRYMGKKLKSIATNNMH